MNCGNPYNPRLSVFYFIKGIVFRSTLKLNSHTDLGGPVDAIVRHRDVEIEDYALFEKARGAGAPLNNPSVLKSSSISGQ